MSTCSVRRIIVTGALLSVVGLTGCAHYTEAEQALQQADELFNSIKDDSQVLASALKMCCERVNHCNVPSNCPVI